MLEYIMKAAEQKPITLAEFTEAIRSGDEERKLKALDRMAEAGGYENLE